MGFPSKPFLCFLFLSPFLFVSLPQTAPDYSTSVYKGCAQQAFQDPNGVYSQAISALFGSIVSQSTKTKFFKITTETGQNTMTGQVSFNVEETLATLTATTDKLRGKTIAARIQLYGCSRFLIVTV